MSHYAAIPPVEPEDAVQGEVYVLCFQQELHYIGWSSDVEQRVADHRRGRGAAITRALVARGMEFEVTAVAAGSRWYERWLKNRGSAKRVCPKCTGRPLPRPKEATDA